MRKISRPEIFQKEMDALRRKGKTIGFVPTLGALHEGHLSLIRRAKKENSITTVSIFVNPIQFGPQEDFKKYPRPMREDCRLLEKEKVDYLFCPSPVSMYPQNFVTLVAVNRLGETLCGPFRPGHFEGVATVVAKLFNLSKPHRVYFGAKDYQQAAIIKKMISDLDFDIEFRLCPTVREKDGLAMSSRNRYLNAEERQRAVAISQLLFAIRDLIAEGERNLSKIKSKARRILARYADEIQYLEIVDPETLQPLKKYQPRMVAAIACFIGKTRLIDNVIIPATKGR